MNLSGECSPQAGCISSALRFELFVATRYLRAKRRNRTISLNTFVSVAGITLGVAALIGTVGIMTGFKEDIQAKILGTTAHIIVQDRMKDGMSDYDAIAKQVEAVPEVVAATPFILKQAGREGDCVGPESCVRAAGRPGKAAPRKAAARR